MSELIAFGCGVVVGWILFKRPQWVTDAFQWIKEKTLGKQDGSG